MSHTSNAHVNSPTYRWLNRRTLTGIQKKVVKQGKRNVVSRFILAKSDKEKIAAWKQDLVRVLHVFNVCLVGPLGAPVNSTVPFQTELAIDTNMAVADTHVVVADTQVVVTDTHTMVADIHRSVLTAQEGTSGKNNSVSATCHPPITDFLPSPRLKSG